LKNIHYQTNKKHLYFVKGRDAFLIVSKGVTALNTPTKGPMIRGLDAFLHTLVLGPTGCGKTSRILKPMVRQAIEAYRNGKKVGITIIEPKGDFAQDVADWCKKLNVPYVHIDPTSPTTHRFNPLQGDALTAAEATRTVLKMLFGKQDPFFSQVQQTAARNTILLLKELHGDDIDLMDVVRTLRDISIIQKKVTQLEKLQGETDLVQFFKSEILGSLRDKYQQFALGLRQQLEDIAGNKYLKNVLSGNSDINLDRHLEEGGVLVVNSEMGRLGQLGDVLGIFLIMHLQNAVFRRPGTEWTRTPHYLFVDEFARYVNPDIERLLAIGRSFRCACIFALQSFAQLNLEGRNAFADIVLTNCRNKIAFAGLSAEDAKRFEREFGEEERVLKQKSYSRMLFGRSLLPDTIKTQTKWESRYNSTQIMEFEAFHFLHRLVSKGQPKAPGYAKGVLSDDLFPEDKKPSKEEEKYKELTEKVRNKLDWAKGKVASVLHKEKENQAQHTDLDFMIHHTNQPSVQPQISLEEIKEETKAISSSVFVEKPKQKEKRYVVRKPVFQGAIPQQSQPQPIPKPNPSYSPQQAESVVQSSILKEVEHPIPKAKTDDFYSVYDFIDNKKEPDSTKDQKDFF
jgi:hypothetical protein